MSWFYADDGAQKGPVSDEEFQRLAAAGTIRAETLVWREGLADWKPFGSLTAPPPVPQPASVAGPTPATATAAAAGPIPPGHVACTECGKVVPEVDSVVLGGRVVCAACKPRVVQRMVEGAGPATGSTFDVQEFLTGLRASGGYPLDTGSCLSRGWELVKANFWPCVGMNLLVLVALGASSQIPCIGIIGQLVLTGPFMGGLYLYFLLQVRGKPATIDDLFSTFRQPKFKELALASLVVQAVPVTVGFVVGFGAVFLPALLSARGNAEPNPMIFLPLIPVILAIVYISFVTFMTYIIVVDAGVGFWDGIKLSVKLVHMRFFTWILFGIVAMVLMMAGMLALCVGLLVVMPILTAAVCYAWTDILQASEQGRSATGAGGTVADLRVS
jgi:hypothetical protein